MKSDKMWKTCLSLPHAYKDKIRMAQIIFDLDNNQINETIAFLIDKSLSEYQEDIDRIIRLKEGDESGRRIPTQND